MHSIRKRLPWLIAGVHLALVLSTIVYVYTSADGQASLVWLFWSIADFPVSLLYFLAPAYSHGAHTLFGDSPVAHMFYLPHVIHAVVGTAWWFFVSHYISGRFTAARHSRDVKA
jgi:hypothetical protein